MGITDYIGSRGEAIAYTLLTRFRRPDGEAYFLPHPLGEKFRTFDYLVEALDPGGVDAYFFAQVKTTRKRFTTTQTPPRLRVEVGGADVRRMVAFPAPVYVIGVHEPEERGFVVSVHGPGADAIPSITTGYELAADTVRLLWDEVRAFWLARDMTRTTSRFPN